MTDIRIFIVSNTGTLALDGYEPPDTRMDAYCIFPSNFMALTGLADEAQCNQSVLWALKDLYTNWRDTELETFSNEDSSEAFETKWHEDFLDDAQDVIPWLEQLTKEQFSQISQAMLLWGSERPSSDDQESAQESMSGQDMAYHIFSEGSGADEAEVLGVEIVEGEHPGSSYYAAELSIPIAEANKKAETAGFDLRFRAEDKNAHGLEQEQHNELVSTMTDGELKIAAQNLKKFMEDRKSSETSSKTESTPSFVVPSHLRAGVAAMKKLYPDASEEELADELSFY